MKIRQVSVFLENKKGRLLEVCSLLGKNNINIRALSIAETEGFGVLRLIVNKPEQATDILRANQLVSNITDVVAIEVEDKPGGLARILDVLERNDVNIEYMYGFIEKFSNNALMVFRFDDLQKAADILKANSIRLLNEKDLNLSI
ncbi:MAG: hypothetical protein A2178_00830 [Planctomycetes bacterium GWC2_49_10]|nr:MAG: hypothetical protein A2178_00830 [Planctomycetes bacterium GWC2_49_10]